MQYGFLIDHTRCIGCHACTVACKQENGVPVGNFRTWVKYVEKGRFPEIRRHFAVLRCNHCTSAPCVTICPVHALGKRPDGIVDLDRDVCIGCRACMQACPYDAIALNEDTGAVEKCHFCAHRTDRGLEPACVTVCPEGAIVPGDLHDSESRIAALVRGNETLVRRPEQGTGPNVHYLGAEPFALEPGDAPAGETWIWSDRRATKPESWPEDLPRVPDARTVLDVDHRVEWGWPVAAYLLTKGIAAGAAFVAPFAAAVGLSGFAADYLPEVLALLFTTLTTALLVEDLARPRKFLTLLTRGNRRSWLVRGAWILILFSGVVSAVLAARFFGFDPLADALRWIGAALGLGVAGYTAFLFAQCEGRDLWQGKRLLPHLLVQAVLCGAAIFLPWAVGDPFLLRGILIVSALLHALFVLLERFVSHPTTNARQAAAFLGRLRYGGVNPLWASLVVGVAVPVALVLFGAAWTFWLVPPLAMGGLYLWEWAFVRAGQLPPLS